MAKSKGKANSFAAFNASKKSKRSGRKSKRK